MQIYELVWEKYTGRNIIRHGSIEVTIGSEESFVAVLDRPK